MKYGKLSDGMLTLAPNPLHIGAFTVSNPTAEQLIKAGFLPIRDSPIPVREGYCYTPYYQQADDELVKCWAEHEDTSNIETVEYRLKSVEKTAEVTADAVEDLIDFVTKGGAE